MRFRLYAASVSVSARHDTVSGDAAWSLLLSFQAKALIVLIILTEDYFEVHPIPS
jgi:hypothetical protein